MSVDPDASAAADVLFAGAVWPADGPVLELDPGETWRRALDLTVRLTASAPELTPDHRLGEDVWLPLDPGHPDPPPDLWPLVGQQLWAAAGQFGWTVDQTDAGLGVAGQGPIPPDASPRLGRDLAGLAGTGPAYAYVHRWLPDQSWTGSMGPRPTGAGPHFLLNPRYLHDGLPDLYWLQLLGPDWVARIGVDRIASAPVHRVAELEGGCWLIQLAPSLASLVSDHEQFLTTRAAAVDHLGAEHFPDLS